MAIIGLDFKKYESRVFDHKGVVLDIGCFGWDWVPEGLKNKKDIIGFDPFEKSCPSWATLVRKVVANFDGQAVVYNAKGNAVTASSLIQKKNYVPCGTIQCVSLQKVIDEYSPISILKMNIEGFEYSLLPSVKHPIADQLIVSFHDNSWTVMDTVPHKLTTLIVDYLSIWYEVREIFPKCQWYLFLKK